MSGFLAAINYKSKNKLKQFKAVQLLLPYKKQLANIYRKAHFAETEFPRELWVENTNFCNASCVMCPREKLTRKLGIMDLSLFEKIVGEASKYDIDRLHLHNFGEPLTDKKIAKRIEIAKKYGIKNTYFVTNASLLNSENGRRIIEAGLDELKISFYGSDEKTYADTMRGLNFEVTINNVLNFFKIRTELRRDNPKVIIQYLPQKSNNSQVLDFLKIFNPVIDKRAGDRISIFSLHNFADGRNYNPTDRVFTTCGYPWQTMVILWDGTAVICCLDYNGLQVVGDAAKDTVYDIWHGQTLSKIREDFKQLRYDAHPICRQCDIIR